MRTNIFLSLLLTAILTAASHLVGCGGDNVGQDFTGQPPNRGARYVGQLAGGGGTRSVGIGGQDAEISDSGMADRTDSQPKPVGSGGVGGQSESNGGSTSEYVVCPADTVELPCSNAPETSMCETPDYVNRVIGCRLSNGRTCAEHC